MEQESDDVRSQLESIWLSMNAARVRAWKGIMYAALAVLAAFMVFLGTESVIWTGGLLLAGVWVAGALRSIWKVNRDANTVQVTYGVNLLVPLPTWLKISNILLIPLAATLGILTLFAALDPTISGDTPTVEIITMIDPTEAEALAAGYEYYSGVEVEVVGGMCAELVIDSAVVIDSSDELIMTFQNTEYDVPEGVHSLVIGTDNPASEAGDSFVVEDAYCY